MASSDGSTVSTTYARKLVATRPAVRISLKNHFRSKVYTSSSKVSGTVEIEPEYDMTFDAIQVLFMGVSKTETDSTAGPIARQHLFLKLQMPIPDEHLPVPRIFERGVCYSFPFTFVIPNYLTINACSHRVNTDRIRDAHLMLPPSMGCWDRDDMAPVMAGVEYAVRARILREPMRPGGKPLKLCEASQRINVLPASYEEPPLSICREDKAYRMSRTKSIKKGLFSSKIGNVTMTAVQPRPVVLRPDGRAAYGTTAHLNLQFNPAAADALPPKVTAVSSKVVAHTYFSNDGFEKFPNIGQWNYEFGQHRRGEYYTSVHLPSPAPPKSKWRQHLVPHARRDSGYGTDSEWDRSPRNSATEVRAPPKKSRTGSCDLSSPIFHSLGLDVPISIPAAKKMFVPTYHSCISSRTYVLHMSVTLTSGSSNTILSVAVPLQIAVEAQDAHQPGVPDLPSWEEVIEQEEAAAADETLMPRVLSVPDVQFYRSNELPGYDAVGSRPVLAL